MDSIHDELRIGVRANSKIMRGACAEMTPYITGQFKFCRYLHSRRKEIEEPLRNKAGHLGRPGLPFGKRLSGVRLF
jgi:hypothetical protein